MTSGGNNCNYLTRTAEQI